MESIQAEHEYGKVDDEQYDMKTAMVRSWFESHVKALFYILYVKKSASTVVIVGLNALRNSNHSIEDA